MKNVGLIIIVFFCCLIEGFPQTQIIINEFSQGSSASKEWIELVITADGTDIRGVYCSDDDVSFATIDFQLKTDLIGFSSVSKGSIIVVYNGADKDGTLPADDTDFSDGLIIIPHTNATFIEASGSWPALGNSGDDFGIFTSLGVGIHGISYGDGTPTTDFDGGWGQADISSVAANTSAYFTEDTPGEAGTGTNWLTQVSTSATPGTLNGGNNNALPVELSSFSAVVLDNAVKLNWRTETEVNNYGFEVERGVGSWQSIAGKWEQIGFVDGHGNSNSPKEYSFTDNLSLTLSHTLTLAYRLKQIDNDGKFEYSKIIEVNLGSPQKFELSQNYPNPFNPVTTIAYSLPHPGNVKLAVYNLLGEQVAELVNGFREAGVHTINFSAENLQSGLYIYKLEANGFVQTRKMTLIK